MRENDAFAYANMMCSALRNVSENAARFDYVLFAPRTENPSVRGGFIIGSAAHRAAKPARKRKRFPKHIKKKFTGSAADHRRSGEKTTFISYT
jgi:hypothetical protein